MKGQTPTLDPPDSLWGHDDLIDSRYELGDTKPSIDTLDSLLRDFSPATPSNTLAELKPVAPFEYLTVSPDTSVGRADPSPTSSSSPGAFKAPPPSHNSLLPPYGAPSEQVSTTTGGYPLGSTDIDDFASILSSTMPDGPLPPLGGGLGGSLSGGLGSVGLIDSPDLDLEALIDRMSPAKSDLAEGLLHSTVSPSGLSPPFQTQLPSTTSLLSEFDLQPQSSLQLANHPPTPTSTPMLQSLLASGNNNYLSSLSDPSSYVKHDVTMPILQARLTQGLKDCTSGLHSPSGGRGLHSPSGGGGLLKADPLFSRVSSNFFKDAMPDAFSTVTTTDDFLSSSRTPSYLEKTTLASPESSDAMSSSTKLNLDFTDLKATKNRSRISKSTKLPIRTEGSKDKPIHHCVVCNRGFLNKSNIKVHLRTHTGEKPFKCETCNKAFRQKAHLLKHYQIHKRGARD